VVAGGQFDHVQLEAGHFVGELLHADLGDCRVDTGVYSLSLLCRGDLPADRVTLAFIGADAGSNRIQGIAVRGAAVAVFPEGSELQQRTAPETRWLALQVRREGLAQLGLDLGATTVLVRPLDANRRRQLQRVVGAAVQTLAGIEARDPDITDGAAAGRAVAEDLLAAFAAVLPSGEPDALARQRRGQTRHGLATQAWKFFAAQLAQPIQVTQLCAGLGISVGTLERACVDSYGVGPKQLLTLLRLARARRLLLSAAAGDTTVSKVAEACGLFHVGRFSTTYAALYGESPSTTLRSTPVAPRTRYRRAEVVSTQPVSQRRHV